MSGHIGVILYGPPGSGKDTVTTALHQLDAQFEQYQRMKIGPGRTAGYRMGTAEDLDRLSAAGQVIYKNHRYSAVYVIDRPELERLLSAGRTPVVHVGQPEAVEAVIAALPSVRWVTVELWCPREIAATRIEDRNTGDTTDRLRTWDETPRLTTADLQIDTSRTDPSTAGQLIAAASCETWTTVVPALHLVKDDGTVDFAGTRRYAEIASRTWVDLFLINGSTTRGDLLSADDRAEILGIWADTAGPHRVLGCAWDQSDATAADEREVTPMVVMRDLATPDAVLRFLRSLPARATIYSHPTLLGGALSPETALLARQEGFLPLGGKLAKVTLEEISEIHRSAPDFQLWDGSSRHIRGSMAAGAAGIVATPLAALLAGEFPSQDMESVQRSANRVQIELDQLPGRPERLNLLRKQLRANLITASVG